MDLKVPEIKASCPLVQQAPLPQTAEAVPGPDRQVRRAGKGVMPRQDLPEGQRRDPFQGGKKVLRACGGVEGVQAAPVEEVPGVKPPRAAS